jgi:hypothetical protein
MNKILVLIPLIAIALAGNAQDQYCGTHQTESDLAWLRNFQANYTASDGERGGDTYYIPMKVHIVGNDEGTGYYNVSYLLTAICELNEHFAATGFVYYIYGDLHYIDETDYYEHNFFDGSDMMDENNVDDLLNIYFVADPAGNCGYFSPSDNAVAVAKSCALPGGTTIAHEFGHYFSLPHTFYGWEFGTPDDDDQEWVNGVNCNTAADGFCDTPPDYLPYRWNCPGPLQTDINGDSFYSDGTFYMSYSNDACTDKFSVEQQDAMIANLLGPRNDMLDFPIPVYVDLTTLPTPVTPEDLATGTFPDYTYIEWTPVEGATQYHLQLAFSASFSAIAEDVITSNNYYEARELLGDKKYFWRVRPLAPLNTCEGTSIAQSFTTGNVLSNIQESELFNQIAVYPNPATAGKNITINYTLLAGFDGSMQIFDVTGKVIVNQQVSLISGNNAINVAIPQVGNGIYFIRFASETSADLIEFMIAE